MACLIPCLLQVLEALALDEPIPDQILDETMPDEEGMESARPQIMVLRVCSLFLPSMRQAHCFPTAAQLLKII